MPTISECVLARQFQCCPTLCTLWAVAHQAPLSMDSPGKDTRNVLPCPPPGDVPNPGIEPTSLASPALAGRFFYHSCHLGSPTSSEAGLNDLLKLLMLIELAQSLLEYNGKVFCKDTKLWLKFSASALGISFTIMINRNLCSHGTHILIRNILKSPN